MINLEQISYAKTVYGQEEVDAVVKCLSESTQMGKYSREFETKIAKLFDKKHCLYVNSGSSALYIGIEAFNFPAKSEVITPALTFSTSVGCTKAQSGFGFRSNFRAICGDCALLSFSVSSRCLLFKKLPQNWSASTTYS